MRQQEPTPRLIHTKFGAVFALCSTGYITALISRNLLLQSHHEPPWLIDPLSLLPTWVVAGINLGFFTCLIWGSAVLYRLAQGKERVLVGCWAICFILGLIQNLVSVSAAAGVEYVKALAMVVAFFTSVNILFKMPASGYPRPDNQPSRNT